MLHIRWMAYCTNVSFLEEINIETRFINRINRNILRSFEQIERGRGTMEQLIEKDNVVDSKTCISYATDRPNKCDHLPCFIKPNIERYGPL